MERLLITEENYHELTKHHKKHLLKLASLITDINPVLNYRSPLIYHFHTLYRRKKPIFVFSIFIKTVILHIKLCISGSIP